MRNLIPAFMSAICSRRPDSRGITGLETAIVLIAFVVVSSVFAFASLTMGLFSADKSEETLRAGLSGARGTLELGVLSSPRPSPLATRAAPPVT